MLTHARTLFCASVPNTADAAACLICDHATRIGRLQKEHRRQIASSAVRWPANETTTLRADAERERIIFVNRCARGPSIPGGFQTRASVLRGLLRKRIVAETHRRFARFARQLAAMIIFAFIERLKTTGKPTLQTMAIRVYRPASQSTRSMRCPPASTPRRLSSVNSHPTHHNHPSTSPSGGKPIGARLIVGSLGIVQP